MPYCTSCGTEYARSAQFCESCGKRASVAATDTSRAVASAVVGPVSVAPPESQPLNAVAELTQADKKVAWRALTSKDLTHDQLVYRRRTNKKILVLMEFSIGTLFLLIAVSSREWGLLIITVLLFFFGIVTVGIDSAKVSNRISGTSCSTPMSGSYATVQLSEEIHKYVRQGYRVVQQTETTAQLVKPKQFKFLWAVFWFLFLGIGLLVYIFYYLAKKDDVLYLEGLPGGRIRLTKQ